MNQWGPSEAFSSQSTLSRACARTHRQHGHGAGIVKGTTRQRKGRATFSSFTRRMKSEELKCRGIIPCSQNTNDQESDDATEPSWHTKAGTDASVLPKALAQQPNTPAARSARGSESKPYQHVGGWR